MERLPNNFLKIKPLVGDLEYFHSCENFLDQWQNDSPKVEVKTSGSTGTPKLIGVEKKFMAASAKKTCDFLGLKVGDSAVVCLPTDYISGKMMLVRGIVRGLEMLTAVPSLKPLETLDQEIDFVAMTPLQAENSLAKLPLVRKIILGGAGVSSTLKEKIYNELGPLAKSEIYETYGMSETLSHIALRQIFPKEQKYFQAMAGVLLSRDGRGCLVISAPDIGVENLVTNDLVEFQNPNEFQVVGRFDNIINSGGGKVLPETLEEILRPFLKTDFAMTGKRDDSLGEKLVLVVAGDFSSTEKKLMEERLKMVPWEKGWHRPKEIIFLEKIPRTETNKIARAQLKNLINGY